MSSFQTKSPPNEEVGELASKMTALEAKVTRQSDLALRKIGAFRMFTDKKFAALEKGQSQITELL